MRQCDLDRLVGRIRKVIAPMCLFRRDQLLMSTLMKLHEVDPEAFTLLLADHREHNRRMAFLSPESNRSTDALYLRSMHEAQYGKDQVAKAVRA